MNQSELRLIWLFVGATLLVFILTRFPPIFRFGILGMVFLVLVILGGRFLLERRKRRMASRNFEKTTLGRIQQRIQYCEDQIQLNEKEKAQIQRNIKELENQLNTGIALAQHNKKDSERLIKGFQKELELRQAKLTFFEQSKSKLEVLYHNHQLAQTLKLKEGELKRLQENHFEDLANMEALKSDVEMDVFYLKTIEELSQKLLDTESVSDVNVLNKELELMTKELDKL